MAVLVDLMWILPCFFWITCISFVVDSLGKLPEIVKMTSATAKTTGPMALPVRNNSFWKWATIYCFQTFCCNKCLLYPTFAADKPFNIFAS